MTVPIMTEHEKENEKIYTNIAAYLGELDEDAFMTKVLSIIKNGSPFSFSAEQLEKFRRIDDLIKEEVVKRSNSGSSSSSIYKALLAVS